MFVNYLNEYFKNSGFVSIFIIILSILYLARHAVFQKSKNKLCKRLNAVPRNWFSEMSPMWDGQAFSLKVHKVLYNKMSPYQHICVFDCGEKWGKILVLDGIIQLTEHDEFAYHEMMGHIPLFSHPFPEQLAIIGGGDGGILREACRHSSLKNIYLCEIDQDVINVSQLYFPKISCALKDERLKLIVDEGSKFLQSQKQKLDVIIVDASDPIGPGEFVYGENFFSIASNALTDNGILCTHAECMWIDPKEIGRIIRIAKKYFPYVEYASIPVPSYPCGSIGLFLSSKNPNYKASLPCRLKNNNSEILSKLNYYTPDIHVASFYLPPFVSKEINKKSCHE